MAPITQYKGNYALTAVLLEHPADGQVLFVQVQDRQKATLFLRLLEGYSHLAFVVPYYPRQAWYLIHTTVDCLPELLAILAGCKMLKMIGFSHPD
ncbi:MAG: hypothetical protein PHC60_07530 [Heliobacteriaceae bacterium]|nr:hypothetical protein [Heliobacteriaceae bacterium]MDD4588220.1 hypothetical protein [Heliobacteriaceae bacterium]